MIIDARDGLGAGHGSDADSASDATSPRLVVGGDSLIGAALLQACRGKGHCAIGTTRRPEDVPTSRRNASVALDLASDPQDWRLPKPVSVAFLCAGINNIEACDRDPERARHINVTQTLALGRRLVEAGAHVVCLSTNLVFDGVRPHAPADSPYAPNASLSCYARCKVEAETGLRALGSAHVTIVRLTKVWETAEPLLQRWATDLCAGRTTEPFADLSLAPVPLDEVVRVLTAIGRTSPGGTVQLSGDHDVTYERIALDLAAKLEADPRLVHPVRASMAGVGPTSVRLHTTLDTARARELFDFQCPGVETLLERLFAKRQVTERAHG